ncbi:MAG: NifU N-terminal domain-containing protein [Anaerolineae bacterium]|nr:NifU N-terminal domain-containing protein [Anaerolineae bacterium]
MPEYIMIETEATDDPDVLLIQTNLRLSEQPEDYDDPASGEAGSPLAQTLFAIEGITALSLDEDTLLVTRAPETEWFILIDEINAALKDFFL